MHLDEGVEHGDAGCFSMHGLARIFAQLHIKTFCFIHFYSGYRREGDLQRQIDHHEVQGCCQNFFCISVDFCLQGEGCNLTTARSRAFWSSQSKSRAVVGVGGGPPCETYTAARLLPEGPPPLRSFDEPLGLPVNSARQWKQTMLGTTLMQFVIEMLFWCACSGGCGFLEHPSFPVWARQHRPASTWTSTAIRWMKRLNCTLVVTYDQCIFQCEGKRPTTLLLLRLPWLRDSIFCRRVTPGIVHINQHHVALQGRSHTGEFRTAIAKVYPPAMNHAIAAAMVQFVQRTFSSISHQTELGEELSALNRMNFVARDVIQPDCYLAV